MILISLPTRILIVANGKIVNGTDNVNEYIGVPFEAAIAELVWKPCKNTFIAGRKLFQVIATMDSKMKDCLPGWNVRYVDKNQKLTRYHDKRRGIRNVYVKDIKYDIRRTKNTRQERRVIQVLNIDLIWDKIKFKDSQEELEAVEEYINLHEERGINRIRETKGALGSALLKASPNWENKRHAAPRFINQFGRSQLPGNLYTRSKITKETSSLNRLDNCYLLDQTSAHHNIAITQTIPHPHFIRARGYFRQAEERKEYYPVWTRPNDPIGQCLMLNHHSGLVLAKVQCGILPPTKEHLYPLWAKKRGGKYIWLWTPELRLFLHDHRLQLDSFVAGFTTVNDDAAVAEYGSWALDYLRSNRGTKKYTKGILLAAYGMLAFNQERYGQSRRYWSNREIRGTEAELPIAGAVRERVINFKQDVQHPMINVIARGVIESETLVRTLEYAKELDNQGYHVCQLYVDGIVLQARNPPFPSHGWRIDSSIPNYFALHDAWIQGDGIHKTPGIPLTIEESESLRYCREAQSRNLINTEKQIARLQDQLDRLAVV